MSGKVNAEQGNVTSDPKVIFTPERDIAIAGISGQVKEQPVSSPTDASVIPTQESSNHSILSAFKQVRPTTAAATKNAKAERNQTDLQYIVPSSLAGPCLDGSHHANLQHAAKQWQLAASTQPATLFSNTAPLLPYHFLPVVTSGPAYNPLLDLSNLLQNPYLPTMAGLNLASTLPFANIIKSDSFKSPPVKKYVCEECGRAFSRSNTLVTHKRIHTGEKPFKCDNCGRAFRQPGNLTRHKLTHTTVKPYVCSICSKAFNRASNLHTHMKTHGAVTNFVCQICGKSFQQAIDLKVHHYTHTGIFARISQS